MVDGGSYAASTGSFNAGYPGLLSKTDNGAPKAYLNWLIFDKNYGFITGGFKQITTAAKEAGTDVAHERVAPSSDIAIAQAGYAYIYLSNEAASPVEVYFDDFKVTHVKSPVIETSDFYPFGLAFNQYQRENSLNNKFKFQGQEHITDLGLNWDSFKWRNYQPEIGRFFNVDPLAEKYVHNSTYAFAENKVITFRELEGLEGIHYMERQ
ncbi:MAG: RHS repeat-associated core domain-containing protein [Bacteroidota bacterium]